MFEFWKSELCPTAFTTASLMLLAAGLLGLLFGYFLWGRYKRRISELEDDLTSLRGKLRKSEANLVDKQDSFDRLDADYASLRTKNRDLEYKLKEAANSVIPTVKAVAPEVKTGLKSTSTSNSITKEVSGVKNTIIKAEPVAKATSTGKRGRPAGSKNITTAAKPATTKTSTGKRGRPAGAKNKVTKVKTSTGKRGRPAGSKNKTTVKKASSAKASTSKKSTAKVVKSKTTVAKATAGKRGRPAGSKNKTTAAKASIAKATTGKRGRPAGSKNKTAKAKPSVVKSTGKRGRPAGSANKAKNLKTSFSAASLTAAKTVFGKKVLANDLTLIEGIGPETSKLFSKNGVKTWATLASKSPSDLRAILESGGNRFQLLEPKTWPRQSKMAASAEWKKLKIYQDKLDGGK